LEAYTILLLVLLAWLLGMITLLSALTGLLRLLAWLLGMITLLSALTTLLATLVLLAALVLVGTSHIGTPLVTIERRLTAPVAITFPIRRFFLFCLTACSCDSERAREIANVACYSGLRLLVRFSFACCEFVIAIPPNMFWNIA
jgi:hypothetical protein